MEKVQVYTDQCLKMIKQLQVLAGIKIVEQAIEKKDEHLKGPHEEDFYQADQSDKSPIDIVGEISNEKLTLQLLQNDLDP